MNYANTQQLTNKWSTELIVKECRDLDAKLANRSRQLYVILKLLCNV